MKVFVSGSKKIEYLNEEMKRILDKLISKKHDILIGDCIGVDLEVQEYLKEKKHERQGTRDRERQGTVLCLHKKQLVFS